ncbi:MAG: Maf family protein, partial [Rhizobiaceae bacterium]
AEAKARDVSARHPGAVVIGCDQTLSFRGEVLHKCFDRAEARQRLKAMAGATHELNSAFALVRDGALLDQHVAIARLTMRAFGEAFIDAYLDQAGADVLASVAAYQIEGRGIQLIAAIDGDYFTIAGLPLLPLLASLRDLGAIDA